jgi:hypothetical protein
MELLPRAYPAPNCTPSVIVVDAWTPGRLDAPTPLASVDGCRTNVGGGSYPGDMASGEQWEPGPGRVPTWRDGVELSAAQKAQLTPEQLQQYLDDSVVRDLAEIETMPEPLRSRVRAMVDQARERTEARISAQEGRRAS